MKTETLKSRTLRIVMIIALLTIFMLPETTFAQPPKWAPAHGYRAKTRHIYFPEQNFYYDVQKRNYIYLSGRSWTISVGLPSIFVGVNLGGARQIELDYVGNTPYVYNTTHKVKYKKVKVKSAVVKKKAVVKGNNGNGPGKSPGKGNGKKK
ncbi:MAG: hypothetical protein V4666_07740 [Bacteroidota bacterium]